MTAPPAGALEACLALLTRMYNSGYAAGHNRTVEGGYVDVFYADRGDYHREEVEELLADDDYKPLAAALRLREGWRPIESAPKDGTSVLVHGTAWIGDPMICEWDMTYGGWFVTGYGDGVSPAPTHWMPLPAPPTADDLARILEQTK